MEENVRQRDGIALDKGLSLKPPCKSIKKLPNDRTPLRSSKTNKLSSGIGEVVRNDRGASGQSKRSTSSSSLPYGEKRSVKCRKLLQNGKEGGACKIDVGVLGEICRNPEEGRSVTKPMHEGSREERASNSQSEEFVGMETKTLFHEYGDLEKSRKNNDDDSSKMDLGEVTNSVTIEQVDSSASHVISNDRAVEESLIDGDCKSERTIQDDTFNDSKMDRTNDDGDNPKISSEMDVDEVSGHNVSLPVIVNGDELDEVSLPVMNAKTHDDTKLDRTDRNEGCKMNGSNVKANSKIDVSSESNLSEIDDKAKLIVEDDIESKTDNKDSESTPTAGDVPVASLAGDNDDRSASASRCDTSQTSEDGIASEASELSLTVEDSVLHHNYARKPGSNESLDTNGIAKENTSPGSSGGGKNLDEETRLVPKLKIKLPHSLKKSPGTMDKSAVCKEWFEAFKKGWVRELVYRKATDESKTRGADVYYYTPNKIKLRSKREVDDYLKKTKSKLTLDSFCFSKFSFHHPPEEIVRDAKTPGEVYSKRKQVRPLPPKKMPKIKQAAPSSSSSSSEEDDEKEDKTDEDKKRASQPPRKKLRLSLKFMKPSSKPSKTSAEPAAISTVSVSKLLNKCRIVKAKTVSTLAIGKADTPNTVKSNGKSSDKVKSPDSSAVVVRDGDGCVKDADAVTPCTLHCPGQKGILPSLNCCVCLCMFHPSCIGLPKNKKIFFCKNCNSAEQLKKNLQPSSNRSKDLSTTMPMEVTTELHVDGEDESDTGNVQKPSVHTLYPASSVVRLVSLPCHPPPLQKAPTTTIATTISSNPPPLRMTQVKIGHPQQTVIRTVTMPQGPLTSLRMPYPVSLVPAVGAYTPRTSLSSSPSIPSTGMMMRVPGNATITYVTPNGTSNNLIGQPGVALSNAITALKTMELGTSTGQIIQGPIASVPQSFTVRLNHTLPGGNLGTIVPAIHPSNTLNAVSSTPRTVPLTPGTRVQRPPTQIPPQIGPVPVAIRAAKTGSSPPSSNNSINQTTYSNSSSTKPTSRSENTPITPSSSSSSTISTNPATSNNNNTMKFLLKTNSGALTEVIVPELKLPPGSATPQPKYIVVNKQGNPTGLVLGIGTSVMQVPILGQAPSKHVDGKKLLQDAMKATPLKPGVTETIVLDDDPDPNSQGVAMKARSGLSDWPASKLSEQVSSANGASTEPSTSQLPPESKPTSEMTDATKAVQPGTGTMDSVKPLCPRVAVKFKIATARHPGTNPGQCSIQLLHGGIEALARVFSFLSSADLARASLVCKTWNFLALQSNLWKSITLDAVKVTDWEKMAGIINKHGTTRLDMRGMKTFDDRNRTWHSFASVLQQLDTLRYIDFGVVPVSIMHTMTNILLHLESLTSEFITDIGKEEEAMISNCRLDVGKFGLLTQLRKLRLRGVHGIQLPTFSMSKGLSTLNSLQNLTHLSLTSLRDVPGSELMFLKSLTKLDTLELGDCVQWTSETYRILDSLQRLRKLRLENGGEIPDQGLGEALSHLPQLEVLELFSFKLDENRLGLHSVGSLEYLSLWPNPEQQAASSNTSILQSITDMQRLHVFVWGLATAVNNPVKAPSNPKEPAKDPKTAADDDDVIELNSDDDSVKSPETESPPEDSECIPFTLTEVTTDDGMNNPVEFVSVNELKSRLGKLLPKTKVAVHKSDLPNARELSSVAYYK